MTDSTPNSIPPDSIRPEILMEELGIKKSAYYNDLTYLGIIPHKDLEGKPYLTKDQADGVRALRLHISENGQRNGFDNSSMVKVDDSKDLASTNNNEPDIYVQPQDPQENLDIDRLMRSAAELKAREIAMPDLVKRAVADKMTEEDLPEDLREKVEAVREAVTPKWTPEGIADNLLTQWRKK
jgi:hypothetical protein